MDCWQPVRDRFTYSSNKGNSKIQIRFSVCVQVRWHKGCTIKMGDYNFFYGKRNKNHQLGTRFFVHHRIVSTIKREEFVSDRVSYIVLRGHWCNIIVLNVHAPSEKKSDD